MGFDKAFLKEGDSYLLQINATRLGSMFEQVLLVSDTIEKLSADDTFGAYRIVEDHYPGTGPLGGICTALEKSSHAYVFIMACDMPSPDLKLISLMSRYLGQAQVVVCEHDAKLETLFAFYHRSCLQVFQRMLSKNILKPRRAFDELSVCTIPLSPEQAGTSFVNLNTREDLTLWNLLERGDTPAGD